MLKHNTSLKNQKSESNTNELLDNQSEINHKKNEIESSEKKSKDQNLPELKKLNKNVHSKPADEQQFENNS